MQRMKKKNYPYYETTVFHDFREMTVNVAKKYPDRVAISYKNKPSDPETQTITYSQAAAEIRALGEAFIKMGVSDKMVLLTGRNSWQWIYMYIALMSVGAVTVPVDKELPAHEIVGIAKRAGCSFVCYGTEIADKIQMLREEMPGLTYVAMGEGEMEGDHTIPNLLAEGQALLDAGSRAYDEYPIDPDKMASIVFTSGTTGKGKGVMLSQTNICSDMTQGMYNFDITRKTVMVLPAHHTFGSTCNIIGHFAQGSEIYVSNGLKYFIREMQEQKPSHMMLVPLFLETLYKKIWQTAEKQGKAKLMRTMMKISNFLLKFGIDLRRKLFKSVHNMLGGNLELVISGGAALNQNIIDTFAALGINILNGYGITECAPLISCNRNLYQKNGSVGMPIVGGKVKILDPDENGEGEICYKGPNVMLGYFDDEEATREVFDEEGYFRTGDYGKVEGDEQWIYITGRKKNMILFSNGKNVYPEEIEAELCTEIYGIGEVVVYAGICDAAPEKEVIVAEIFPDAEALALRDVTDYKDYFEKEVKRVNDRFVSYKRIGHVKIRDVEFEKNTSRKIQRFKIDRHI